LLISLPIESISLRRRAGSGNSVPLEVFAMVSLRVCWESRRKKHCRKPGLQRVVAFLLLLAFCGSSSALAGDSLRDSTSLQFVPADAAFYRVCLRNREQFEALMQSNALRQLLERPGMSEWLARLKARWDNPDRSLIGRWLAKPENRELLGLAGEALSQEVFWYGEDSFAELLDLTAYVNEAAAAAQLAAIRRGSSLADSERAAAYAALRIVADDPEELHVPAMVVGFRVTDRERALRQIARLDELLASLLDPAQARLREQINGEEFFTWRLSGGMLPWDLVPKSEMEKVDPELRRRVRAVLESKQATLTVGLRGDYLLVSLGETNSHLEKLGEGPLLVDRPELAPLADAEGRALNTIVYVSQAYRQRAEVANRRQSTGSFLLEEFIKHPDGLGQGNRSLDEMTRRELVADMKRMAAQLSDVARARGATLRYSHLTPHGYEGRLYDWSQYDRLNGDEPLTVLNHLGGEPLGFFAMRRDWTVDDYEQGVQWLRRGVHYFEKIGLEEMTPERQAAYARMRRQLEPQLARLDRATRELLIPSVADGQKALVLDASPRSETVFAERRGEDESMIPSDAMPRLELACVIGVSDPGRFKQACQEYLAVAGEAWNGVREFVEEGRTGADAITDAPRLLNFDLPPSGDLRPRTATTDRGEVYYYELPSAMRAAERVAPNLALSRDFAVMSWLPLYSQRLLTSEPLQVDGGPADADRPLAAAAYLNIAGIIDAVEPWLELASQRRQDRLAAKEPQRQQTSRNDAASGNPAAETKPAPRVISAPPSPRAPQPRAAAPSPRIPQPPQPSHAPAPRIPAPPATRSTPEPRQQARSATAAPRFSPQEAKERLHFTLDLLRCFRSFSFATHQEGDALVTHYEIRIEDLKSGNGRSAP
jgi:hypothetical protein